MLSKIQYLVLSDIHLGHTKNKTDNIIKNLNHFFKTYHKDIIECKVIFISGDVFDRLLTTKSVEYRHSMAWLSNLLLFCKEHDIALRILYGTPSHDMEQISAFEEIAKKLYPEADFKYNNTLSIEYMDKLGISVLYVPDEWRHDAKDTYKEALALMKEKSLAQVDIAIMHGCFGYQMPMVKDKSFCHLESNYLDIVKFYITIGHIHTSSTYERIIAPGSFDRLAHGEEEAKGGIICTICADGTMSFKFLQNIHSCIFKSIDYIGRLEADIVSDLKKELKKLPIGSHIRLLVDNDSNLLKNLRDLLANYPDYNIKFKTDNTVVKKIDILELAKIETIAITANNIEDLLLKEVQLDSSELAIFKEELKLAIGDLW